MARRNLLEDATSLDFICDLSPGPLTDGTLGLGGRFTGKRHNLANLLCCDRRWLARTGCILQPLAHAQFLEGNRLPVQPAAAPQAHCIGMHLFVSSNLAVGLTSGCRQDEPALATLSAVGCYGGTQVAEALGSLYLSTLSRGLWVQASLASFFTHELRKKIRMLSNSTHSINFYTIP